MRQIVVRIPIKEILLGPPGLDKSALLRGATRLVSNSRFLSSLNSSTTSQIGIVDKEDDRYMLRLGPIPRAAGRICAIDEMGRMRPEDQGKLLHALQEGMMPFVKYGFDLMLDGRATFIMASNTKNPSGDFNDANKVSSDEIPIISQVMDRTGLVFVLRANRTLGYSIDFGFKKLNIINNINTDQRKLG